MTSLYCCADVHKKTHECRNCHDAAQCSAKLVCRSIIIEADQMELFAKLLFFNEELTAELVEAAVSIPEIGIDDTEQDDRVFWEF